MPLASNLYTYNNYKAALNYSATKRIICQACKRAAMNCWTETAHVARDGLLQACTRFSFTYFFISCFIFISWMFVLSLSLQACYDLLVRMSDRAVSPLLVPPPPPTEKKKDIKIMNSVHLECGRDRVKFQKTSCYLYSGKCCAAEWYKSQGKVRSRLYDGISSRFTAGGALCTETGERVMWSTRALKLHSYISSVRIMHNCNFACCTVRVWNFVSHIQEET